MLVPALGCVVAVGVAATGCFLTSDEPPDPPASSPAAAPVVRTSLPAETVVIPAESAAARAIATSEALFVRAPLVVLAGVDDPAGQAEAGTLAERLRAPLLLTPAGERLDGAALPTASAAAPRPSGDPPAADAALRAELTRLDPVTVVPVGTSATRWAAGDPALPVVPAGDANGLSDWAVDDLSADAMLADLEAIVAASGIERFALLGISQGCAITVMYAVRHPERVSHLVLYGGYVRGWRARGDPAEIARRSAMGVLIRRGWGQNNPAFRQMFASLFIPGATQEHMHWFNELQLKSVSPDNAARLHNAFGNIDVAGLLEQVSTPTLVLHARDDAVVPFEQGLEFASGIPNARFVPLDSGNHILLENEPAFARFLREVHDFIDRRQ